MPRSLPDSPRKMLPPPTTMTISTPSWRTSPTCRAMSWIDFGQMPTPDSPPSASPLSLSRMREYFGLPGLVIDGGRFSNRLRPSQIKDRHRPRSVWVAPAFTPIPRHRARPAQTRLLSRDASRCGSRRRRLANLKTNETADDDFVAELF